MDQNHTGYRTVNIVNNRYQQRARGGRTAFSRDMDSHNMNAFPI